MSKTPKTIVDEIQKRLISKIESDFQNLQEKKLARARDELDRQAAIRGIAQIAGIELPKDLSRVYNLTKFFTHNEVYVHCQVDNSDSVRMTLRHVHPSSAQKIIQVLNEQT
jgi:NADH:ubiquinone oxidoreductase subunit C